MEPTVNHKTAAVAAAKEEAVVFGGCYQGDKYRLVMKIRQIMGSFRAISYPSVGGD